MFYSWNTGDLSDLNLKAAFRRDCGLACASSILKTLGMVSLEKWSGIQTPKRSLWTIEIVHLLHQFGVQQLIYTTTCLGVNHDYLEKLKFYADEENEDIGVINALFKVRVLAALVPAKLVVSI